MNFMFSEMVWNFDKFKLHKIMQMEPSGNSNAKFKNLHNFYYSSSYSPMEELVSIMMITCW